MQKKVFIIIAVAVLVVAAVACAVFLIQTADLAPESKELNLEGTWRVFRKGSEDPGNEYFVFSETTVNDYRNGNPTPALESQYALNGNVVTIDALGQNFTIEKKGQNTLLLYNDASEFLVVKVAQGAHTANVSYSQADLSGTYEVVLHANSVYGNEVLEFNADKFICKRNGEVYLETTYTINNNTISLVTANGAMNFVVCYVGEDGIRFAEYSSNGSYLSWEIKPLEN